MVKLQKPALSDLKHVPKHANAETCSEKCSLMVSRMVNSLTMTRTTSPGPWERAIVSQIEIERAAQRMPVKELAKRARVHPGSMPRYMNGSRHLTLDLVESFAAALGLDADTLARRAKERQSEISRPDLQIASNGLDGGEREVADDG